MRDETGSVHAMLGRPGWVRLRAVLATGLVLGLGATWSLAGWTDRTTVTAQFAASTFVVETNTSAPHDGADSHWAPSSAGAAVLQLDASGMTPGSTVHAPLALRTSTGSLGGEAVLAGAEVTQLTQVPAEAPELADALAYRVVVDLECVPEAFGTGADFLIGDVATSMSLTTGQDLSAPLELPAATEGAPGQPIHLCVELTLPEGAPTELQGQQVSARWTIASISETT